MWFVFREAGRSTTRLYPLDPRASTRSREVGGHLFMVIVIVLPLSPMTKICSPIHPLASQCNDAEDASCMGRKWHHPTASSSRCAPSCIMCGLISTIAATRVARINVALHHTEANTYATIAPHCGWCGLRCRVANEPFSFEYKTPDPPHSGIGMIEIISYSPTVTVFPRTHDHEARPKLS